LARPEKVAQVESLSGLLAGSEAAILVDYRSLNVAQMAALRRAVRETNAQLRVVKNTLFRRALAGTEAEPLSECVAGPVGVAFCRDDVGATAKALLEFQKTNEALQIKAAFADGRVYDAAQLVVRSTMPGRKELLGQLAYVLNAPVASLAHRLNEIITKLPRALSEVAKSREGQAA